MKMIKDLSKEEFSELYKILELDKEESDIKYPEIHKSNGMRIQFYGEDVIVDNDNNWGYEYIFYKNGVVVSRCKDDDSSRNYFDFGKIIKFLLTKNIDLLNLGRVTES